MHFVVNHNKTLRRFPKIQFLDLDLPEIVLADITNCLENTPKPKGNCKEGKRGQ